MWHTHTHRRNIKERDQPPIEEELTCVKDQEGVKLAVSVVVVAGGRSSGCITSSEDRSPSWRRLSAWSTGPWAPCARRDRGPDSGEAPYDTIDYVLVSDV